jgi:hypothetical protein
LHNESFDIWSNEFISHLPNRESLKPKNYKLNELLGVSASAQINNSNKVSIVSVYEVFTCENYSNLTGFETKTSTYHTSVFDQRNDGIYMIENVSKYESPLRMFRGYRFSANYEKLNSFDEAYSKFYCHNIDFRRPFCPFDLHGSCKDSACIYQHSNVFTMDNIQRTEHLLSYCPQLLGLSCEKPTQREAVKKLSKFFG